MAVLKEFKTRIRRKCPRCWCFSYMTDWLPPRGLEPQLRQFECNRCHVVNYCPVPLDMTRRFELALSNRARERKR